MGVANYYRDIRERHQHKLSPLTKIMSSKVTFKWTDIEQDTFDEIKRIVAYDTLLHYQDFNEEFKIHTDARDLQEIQTN